MRVHYLPTFADYWALNVFVLRRQFRKINIVAAGLVLLFLAYPWLPNPNRGNVSIFEYYRSSWGLLVLPGIVVCTFAATYWGARKRWAVADELREEREYVFDESGLRTKSASIDASIEWRIFKEAVITRDFVYLITAQRQFHYFPVTAVDDLPRLQALLREKIPNAKNARKPRG